ncbi:MAG: ACT domain-containing protein [Planctomycetes bacterium]|nr:ACT domain-containing protein [Planctomycetota bacterium]
MRQGLIISAIGKDQPGIVDRASGLIFQHQCNLEDSRMAILGGEFALIVLVTGPAEALSCLEEELPRLAGEMGLTLQIRRTRLEEALPEHAAKTLPYQITAVAMDHPGIVHRLSHVLARHHVNVASLETHRTHAPNTGTPVFSLSIEAQVPVEVPIARLRSALEAIADEENLDLQFRAKN